MARNDYFMDLTNRSELISYLKSHGLWAKHGLGQNFLVDKEALGKIIEAAELKPDDLVIEVGPGLGVLTEELIKKAGQVVAIELDEKLAALLAQSLNTVISTPHGMRAEKSISKDLSTTTRRVPFGARDDKFKVVNLDILKLNIPELVGDNKYKVVANIPYYITSKIIERFLTLENKPELIVLLVQKEVAERICAKPGKLSILALSVQAYGQPEIIDIVRKESFFPSPEVDSAILRIKNIHPFSIPPLNLPLSKGEREGVEKDFFRLIHIGFASKRKTLVNNLTAGYHLDKEKAKGIIESVGLDENVRAQELSLDQWATLAKRIMNQES